MQHQFFLFVKNTAFLLLLVFFSCSTDDDDKPTPEVFLKMESCRSVPITDSAAIYQHLIAEWDLIGYACGFCNDPDLPHGNVVLEEGFGVLHFQGMSDDSIVSTNFTWQLVPVNSSTEPLAVYAIQTDPYLAPIQCNVYCRKYMFYDDTPVDGEAYLFEKQ